MHPAQYLRRKEAAAYLRAQFGYGATQTLAKYAVFPPMALRLGCGTKGATARMLTYLQSAFAAAALSQ